MAITIGANIASLRAQRRLSESTSSLSKSFERLSSGMRINRASDDAAGLAIAGSLNADSRVFAQALRNVNDGLSALTIEEGALDQLSNILLRQRELVEQAANGTYSREQRKALDMEANTLVDEYNRIVESTEFNGRKLIESGGIDLRIQAGYGVEGSISFKLAEELSRTVGDGTFQANQRYGDITSPISVVTRDFNHDGNLDLASAANNGHGIYDLTTGDLDDNGISVLIGNGDGTFKARASFASGQAPRHITHGDLNGDGAIDVITADQASSPKSLSILMGNTTQQTKMPHLWLFSREQALSEMAVMRSLSA